MEEFVASVQFLLDALSTGTSALYDVGGGTIDYGTAEQKISTGTDKFAKAFKTLFNFLPRIAALFNVEMGTVK